MNNRNLIIVLSIVVVLMIVSAAIFLRIGSTDEQAYDLPSLGGDSAPLQNMPDVNPTEKTNPFKDIKTNPFE